MAKSCCRSAQRLQAVQFTHNVRAPDLQPAHRRVQLPRLLYRCHARSTNEVGKLN